MRRLVSVALTIAGLVSFPSAPDAGRGVPAGIPRILTVSTVHGGLTRTAWVVVPSGYRTGTPVPLVFSFHGRDSDGMVQAWLSELHEVGELHKFIVVYPDGVGGSWNALHGTGEAEALGLDDVGYVDALLAQLSGRFSVDPDRVYASGMSNGGFLAHRLGCERSSRFAAIASVAGGLSPALERVCRPDRAIAVLNVHGKDDPVVPYAGGMTLGGGAVLPAERTAAVWSALNHGSGQAVETFRQEEVVCRSFQDGRAPVTLCSIEGGGHTWPGGNEYAPEEVGATNQTFNASQKIWEFFQANPRRAALPGPSNLRVLSGKLP